MKTQKIKFSIGNVIWRSGAAFVRLVDSFPTEKEARNAAKNIFQVFAVPANNKSTSLYFNEVTQL